MLCFGLCSVVSLNMTQHLNYMHLSPHRFAFWAVTTCAAVCITFQHLLSWKKWTCQKWFLSAGVNNKPYISTETFHPTNFLCSWSFKSWSHYIKLVIHQVKSLHKSLRSRLLNVPGQHGRLLLQIYPLMTDFTGIWFSVGVSVKPRPSLVLLRVQSVSGGHGTWQRWSLWDASSCGPTCSHVEHGVNLSRL